MKIPKENKDLRKYALWTTLKRPLFYALYIAFFGYAFWFYLEKRHEDAEPLTWWVYWLFAAVVVVSGWLLCNMSRFFLDRPVCGIIGDSRFVRNYGRGLSRRATLSVDFHTYVKLTVITEKGKKRRVTVPLFDDGYDGYYRAGGTLVKLRGLTYPLCVESEKDGVHLCTVCGVRTYYKEGKAVNGEAEPEIVNGMLICRCCGKTMINVESIYEKGE
ncbi:MAG: hypothetical protein IJY39_11865 [Clostridia bacterium]|nr:hypothetical protein [Clostridia bacterium]